MDLIAGATGDAPHMGAFGLEVNSQTETSSDARSHMLEDFRIEDADIIDTLAVFPPRKQQAQTMERDGEDNVALHPHRR